MNRSVPRGNTDRAPAAIDLPVDRRMAERAYDADRNVISNVAVTSMHVQIRTKISWQTQIDVPIARVQGPTAGDLRSARRFRFDAAVARLQVQRVKPPAD